MAEVLSQNEIDALLSAVSSGEVETESEALVPSGTITSVDWTQYDISSQERFVRSRLAGLDGIHDRFCRKFRASLLTLFHRQVSVNFRSLELVRFGEFLTNAVLPSSFVILKSKQPSCNFMFVVGSKLVYALIDAYYGGNERPFGKLVNRDAFTAIENSLIRKVIDRARLDLMEAWRLNFPLELTYSSMESDPHFVGSIHGSETAAIVNFEVEFETLSGPFVLVVPVHPLETIRKELSVNVTREVDSNEAVWRSHWWKELMKLPLDIEVALGSTTRTLKQISGLKSGEVLALNQDVAGDLSVTVEGIRKLKGKMGAYRGSAAVRITDISPFESKPSEQKENEETSNG